MRFDRLLMAVSVFLLGPVAWSQASPAAAPAAAAPAAAAYDPRLTFAPLAARSGEHLSFERRGSWPCLLAERTGLRDPRSARHCREGIAQRRGNHLHQQQS